MTFNELNRIYELKKSINDLFTMEFDVNNVNGRYKISLKKLLEQFIKELKARGLTFLSSNIRIAFNKDYELSYMELNDIKTCSDNIALYTTFTEFIRRNIEAKDVYEILKPLANKYKIREYKVTFTVVEEAINSYTAIVHSKEELDTLVDRLNEDPSSIWNEECNFETTEDSTVITSPTIIDIEEI